MDGDETDTTIAATRNSFRVLDALVESGPVGVTDLDASLDLSKSTIYNHLVTLEELGYVVRDGTTYRVGLRFERLAANARNRYPFVGRAVPEIERLAKNSGLRTAVVVEENGWGVCVETVAGSDDVDPPMRPGERLALHASAPGKAILSALPDAEVQHLLDRRGLFALTDDTITTWDELRADLQNARERRLAIEREESRPGLSGVATPITDLQGRVLGAICVFSAVESMSGKRVRQDLPGLLANTKRRIENDLRPGSDEG